MTRHRPTEERRAQLLDAARRCFLERGYQATRVEDIALQAGLSKGALYFHFDSKRALLDALVEEEFEQAIGILESAEDPLGLGSVFEAFIRFLGEHDELRNRFFLLTGELAVHDEALRDKILGHHRSLVARLAEVLAALAEARGRTLADPEALAVLLKGMADGLQGARALGHDFDPLRLVAAALGLIDGGLWGPPQAAGGRVRLDRRAPTE